ncbi:hypothetical protein Sjap_003793 [Stephania japonica]|uniref:Uncharacterized protein n=1 Tax=Stephania japonica TaxID=461633 RepID=A0AAP0KPI4_9MAGN
MNWGLVGLTPCSRPAGKMSPLHFLSQMNWKPVRLSFTIPLPPLINKNNNNNNNNNNDDNKLTFVFSSPDLDLSFPTDSSLFLLLFPLSVSLTASMEM